MYMLMGWSPSHIPRSCIDEIFDTSKNCQMNMISVFERNLRINRFPAKKSVDIRPDIEGVLAA